MSDVVTFPVNLVGPPAVMGDNGMVYVRVHTEYKPGICMATHMGYGGQLEHYVLVEYGPGRPLAQFWAADGDVMPYWG
jgi:hypothetical protein